MIRDWKLSSSTKILMVLEDQFLLCSGLTAHPDSAEMAGSGLICSASNLNIEKNPEVNNYLLKKLNAIN